MSVRASDAVWSLPADACTTSGRLLLLALADEASDEGEVSAYARSQRYLAKKCGWTTEEAVRKAMTKLIDAGLVLVLERGSGRAQSSYLLPFVRRGHEQEGPQPTEGSDPDALRGEAPPQVGGHHPVLSLSDPIGENMGASAPERTPAELRDFNAWWASYPRKLGKRDAEKSWRACLRAGVAATTIIEGTARWTEHWRRERTEVRFIPHPATFLNRARWDDDPPPVRGNVIQHPSARVDNDRAAPSGRVEL